MNRRAMKYIKREEEIEFEYRKILNKSSIDSANNQQDDKSENTPLWYKECKSSGEIGQEIILIEDFKQYSNEIESINEEKNTTTIPAEDFKKYSNEIENIDGIIERCIKTHPIGDRIIIRDAIETRSILKRKLGFLIKSPDSQK
eukprot:GHVP01053890.1.p1 GENE.GHVP01053890.1~~GHVP01053890.1.p1  ORF type:complete len:144 (-),score=24.44 GHVP01053890.1:844-1275(-)